MKAIETSNGGFYPQIDSLGLSDNFIYYSSLLGASNNPVAYQTGVAAKNYLYKNNIFNPTKSGKTSTVIQQALKMLQAAANNEKAKEERYLEILRKKFPDNKFLNQSSTDYAMLILQLNSALKNSSILKREINEEYKRWQVYMENYDEVERKKRAFLSEKNNDIKKQKKAEYDAARRIYVGSSTFGKVGKFDSAFSASWKKNANTIVNIVKEVVIEKFGASLFKMSGNKLILNQTQITLLVKELASRVYETLLFSNDWNNAKGSSQKRRWLNQNIDSIIQETFQTQNADSIVESLKETAVSNSHIDTILQLYKSNGFTSVQGNELARQMLSNKTQLNRLRQYSKKAYEAATGKRANVRSRDFKNWIANNPEFSESELLKQASIMDLIKVQVYYTSEDRAFQEIISQGVSMCFEQGSGHNTKADIEAGELVVELSADSSGIDDRINAIQEKMVSGTAQKLQALRVGSSAEDYEKNYQNFLAIRNEQLENLAQMQEIIEQQEEDILEALSFFNIHTSVKDQTGNIYGEVGAGFHGGDVGEGSNALSFLENVKSLYLKSGVQISDADLTWLRLAIINSGGGLIGGRNKSSLEAYFSMFVSFLMFDDAYNIVEDAFSDSSEIYNSMPDIHLYVFNGIYVPLSYMLNKIYLELSNFSTSLQSYISSGNKEMARVIISGYNVSGNPGNKQEAWYREGSAAAEATTIKVILMSGFYDLLAQLQNLIDMI